MHCVASQLLILFFLFVIPLYGSEKELDHQNQKKEENKTKEQSETKKKDSAKPEPEKLVKMGNLAFPASQQPQPLVAFGQNIVNKNQAQILYLTSLIKNRRETFVTLVPTFLYGLKDDLSLLISAPFAAHHRQEKERSSGWGDMIVQIEYAPLTIEKVTYYDQITIVANFTIPTGSAKKKPPTGNGTNSFFIGGIYSRMAVNWFYFNSYAQIFNTENKRTKFGDIFLYQGGVGRRIFNTSEWLFAAMVEIDGFYTWKDKIRGVIDPNSGGNVIYLTPSIFISSKEHLIVQFGMGIPIQQHLFGHQNRKEFLLALNLEWTF